MLGELYAFQLLQREWGEQVVRLDAWRSENRLKLFPLASGEEDLTNDRAGFDFSFTHKGITWCVEVKSTVGDEPRFELGTSEVRAAKERAGSDTERWRILRMKGLASEQPTYDLLPNPFEGAHRERFKIHRAGMKLSYQQVPKEEFTN